MAERTISPGIRAIVEAIEARATADEMMGLEVPETYRGITIHDDEVDLFDGVPSAEKDPRQSLHLDEVPVPELQPGDALIAVMASAINYNTIWSAIFEPRPTFAFLKRNSRRNTL